jgi:hypothetical protein
MLAIALLGTFVAQSAWACKVPMSPRSIPDGRSAAVEGMLESKRQVEQYLEDVADYTGCEKNALKLQEVLASKKLIMDRFNAEVREFKQVRTVKVASRQ